MTDADPVYETTESQPSTTTPTEAAPSWVASIIILLTQYLRTLQSERQSTIVPETRPGHSQPHLEKFSGLDFSESHQFRSLLGSKIRIDANTIGSEKERLWYGFDTERITKAIDKLNSRRQGNRDFREFLQDVEQTLLEAQGWSDQVKNEYHSATLNGELYDRLVSQDEPQGCNEYVTKLRANSDKLGVIKAWDSRRNYGRNLPPPNSYPQVPNASEDGDSMDWEPT
ncbi:hypothetical protein Golomagni_00132 [Golovinomyces magnicellulatus]|nr:hypothetical protein Golomagni_00132 [Golovinomyces magnicellulatus]